MDLPLIDEHCVDVAASPEDAWAALAEVVPQAFSGPGKERFARILGCEHQKASGPRPIREGSTFAGFRVAEASPPVSLQLRGRHRFSRYALRVRIEPLQQSGARIRAETRAAFPGPAGAVYRALVIGTRLHVVVVRRILGAVKARTERPR